MSRFAFVRRAAFASVFASLAYGSPALAADFHSNDTLPLTMSVYVSCANGGAGEVVDLSGELHQAVLINVSEAGRVTITIKSQPQNVSGIGRITRDHYRGTGGSQLQEHFGTAGTFPFLFTSLDNFRVIGQGPNNNFTAHYLTHLTVNANGAVASEFTNFNADCK